MYLDCLLRKPASLDAGSSHGRVELDAAGFIRAEKNFFVKIRHIIYAIQNRLSCEPAFVYVLYIQCKYRDKIHLLILWKT